MPSLASNLNCLTTSYVPETRMMPAIGGTRMSPPKISQLAIPTETLTRDALTGLRTLLSVLVLYTNFVNGNGEGWGFRLGAEAYDVLAKWASRERTTASCTTVSYTSARFVSIVRSAVIRKHKRSIPGRYARPIHIPIHRNCAVSAFLLFSRSRAPLARACRVLTKR